MNTQAAQEQLILSSAYARLDAYNAHARKWTGKRKTFTFRVNTAPLSLYHTDKCKSRKVVY